MVKISSDERVVLGETGVCNVEECPIYHAHGHLVTIAQIFIYMQVIEMLAKLVS